MVQSRKYKRVTVRSNADEVVNELQQYLRDFKQGMAGIRVENDLHYAKFVEYGTVKMAPRAMMRRSQPEIEAYFEREFYNLKEFPPRKEEVLSALSRVASFALITIQSKTPVKTGALKAAWKIKPPKIYSEGQQ